MGTTPTDFPAINPSAPPSARSEARLDRSAAAADRELRTVIATQLISALTDWLGIICLTVLIGLKALGPEFGWAIPALAAGTTVAKARGLKGVASTTALLLAAGPVLWKLAAGTVLATALLFLVGCGSAQVPPSVVQDARAAVDKADAALAATGPHLLNLRKLVIKLCGEPPILPREECDHAQATFNAIGQGYDDLGQLADTADLVVTFAEASQ